MCGEMIISTAKVCRFCGERFGAAADTEGDVTDGVIPYKNAPALIAYYCGVLSLAACIPIPFLFLPLPIVALICGIKGLRKAKAQPHVRGRVHAWIGVIAGSIFTVLGLGMTVVGIAAIIAYMKQR
jgi:hypothetical protein